VTVVGLDDTSLYGRPELIEGTIDDIYAENAFVVVKDAEFEKLGNPTRGTEFELNDHRGVIVGIARVTSSGLIGVPTLYTTYKRAIQLIRLLFADSFRNYAPLLQSAFRHFNSLQAAARREAAKELSESLINEVTSKGLPLTRRNFQAAAGGPIMPYSLLYRLLKEVLQGGKFSAN
jgi:hypothetical protein